MDRETSPRLANGAGSARLTADERGDGSKHEHVVPPTSAPALSASASRYEHDSEQAAAEVLPPDDVPSAIAPQRNSTNDGNPGSPSSSSSSASALSSPLLSPLSPPDHMPEPPPYWSMPSAPRHRAQRSISAASYQSLEARPAAIHLEDRSSEDAHETARACWAHSVRVDEYVVVSGATGIGAYVVWHCTVRTLQGGDLFLRKRYSEFDQLRTDLVRAFPHAEAMIPALPRKSVVSRFRPKFLEHRRAGLSHFLNCILLNPEFAASPILKDFIFY